MSGPSIVLFRRAIMPFQPVKKLRLAEQVARAIRDAIVEGSFDEGENLPSERALADQFGVNRSSVREAMHRLEAWGLVDVKHGGGARVRDVFLSAGLQLLPLLIAPGGQIDEQIARDILRIRVMFLAGTARMAAERPAPRDVSGLREQLDRLGRLKSAAGRQKAEFAFFQELVELADNRVLQLFARLLADAYERNATHFRFLCEDPYEVAWHETATDAIERGDADAAADAMRAFGRDGVERLDAQR